MEKADKALDDIEDDLVQCNCTEDTETSPRKKVSFVNDVKIKKNPHAVLLSVTKWI